MKAQTPAEGILLKKKYDAWRWYEVPCECGCDNKVEIHIEIDDPDDNFVTCHIASRLKTAYWNETFPVTYNEPMLVQGAKQLANTVIRRLQICWTALTKGYLVTESYTLLSKQQALNLSTVLVTAIDEIENEYKAKRAKVTKLAKV
jgi:hypothetical protein